MARETEPRWPAGVGVPTRTVPRHEPLAVCEAWVLPKTEVDGWLKRAEPGDVLVYMRGPRPIHGETLDRVRSLADGKRVEQLPQRRAEGCFGYEYRIVRRADPASPKASQGGAFDAQTRLILEAIRRCVRRGSRVTDLQLARIAGLATRDQARWRRLKIEEAGLIRTETIASAEGPWLVVTIGKRSSARPTGRPSA